MKTKSLIQYLAHWPINSLILAAACFVLLTGCETSKPSSKDMASRTGKGSNDIVLKAADVVKIIFAGAEKLDTTQTIRPDGKITLPIIGELMAAGKTPADLKKELSGLYSKELVSSGDIAVAVVSASYPVYVNGAVQKPGKITVDHPMTVLEAIMESGGPNYDKANLKSVKVIRTENGQTRNYTVNLKGVLNGSSIDIFYVQPSDIIYVPEKITWF